MLTDLFRKKTIPIDIEYGFKSIVLLVARHNLPFDRSDLVSLGKEEGLSGEFIEKAVDESVGYNPELENEGFRQWCLERIIRTLINKVGRIDEDLYKILVNLVNGLYLKFLLLDSTIKKVKRERIKIL